MNADFINTAERAISTQTDLLAKSAGKLCFRSLAHRTTPECAGCSLVDLCADSDRSQAAYFLDIGIEAFLFQMSCDEASSQTVPEVFPKIQKVRRTSSRIRTSPVEQLVIDKGNVVSSAEVLASGQYQFRAREVTWPAIFYMETGKDHRHLDCSVEDKNKRHQIDWFRPGSYVEPMPSLEALAATGNPYSGANGISAHIARTTFDIISDQPGSAVFPKDIEAEVLRLCDSTLSYDRISVRDAMRDMALFGILWRVPGRTVSFVLSSL